MLKKCDGRTDGRTNGQTDLCIELRYAQLIIALVRLLSFCKGYNRLDGFLRLKRYLCCREFEQCYEEQGWGWLHHPDHCGARCLTVTSSSPAWRCPSVQIATGLPQPVFR